jgi:hypothetical protein
LLACEFFLILVRAGLTAEVIGLPSNIFRHCYSPWNKYQANGILNHLILAGGKTLWLPLAFEPSKGSPKKEVQHDKQPKNENNSIHGGTLFLMPQSYGTGLPVSRTPLSLITATPLESLPYFRIKRPIGI